MPENDSNERRANDPNERPEHPDEPWERMFDGAVRELPLRRAPTSLESRVFRELERRAALPWWRRSFTHWPLAARAAFLLICGASAGLAITGAAAAAADVRSLYWAREIGALMASGGNLVTVLAGTAPPLWFYEGIAVCGVLYAILFGLGAVLYRTLYLQPFDGR
jgi:hypothetical protein